MKKTYILILLCLPVLFAGCSTGKKAVRSNAKAEFRAATYNVRYAAQMDEDSGNGWDIRKGPLTELIINHDFDIVGTQEANEKQLGEMKALLPGYDCIGYPYGGRSGNSHNCATFFKTDLFDVLDKGVFWLSETPDVMSIGWDATDRRICQWAKFRHKPSGKKFYFFNAHFYWKHKTAKEESGPLMVRKIEEIAGDVPAILTGDLNSNPQTTQMAAIRELLSDSFEVSASPPKGPEGTGFPGGVFEGTPGSRIDYIYISQQFKATGYEVLTDSYNDGHYPSDHLPIVCVLSLE